MEYNWKYAKIRSSSAFKVWQRWDSQTKIKFLELCKNDYSGKLRLFACWSIEEIIGTDNLENDENSSLLIAKKVAKGRMKLKKLLAAKGRYRTPYDYDNMELNKRADIRRGPDQRNIIWLRVMNKLCNINAYDTAKKVLKILSDVYKIPAPNLGKIRKERKEYAMYDYDTKTVLLYSRNHLKSIYHEFYHHLDNMTNGKYNSDDREGSSSSLAWIFADKLWVKFTNKSGIS